MRLTKKLGWVVALCSLVALGACVQSPKGGDSIIGRDPGALTQEQGVAYCYRVCHQGFPSAGYGPWDASGWYSQAGTPLVTTPQYLGLSPAQQAAAVLSTWQHPGWGMTPEPFDTGLKVWYLDTTLLKSVDPALPRFFFRSANSLSATHFGELWVTNEADQVTIFNPPMGSEGESRRNGQFWLVDMQFNPPNTGVVNSSAPGACTASCHRSHPAGGIEINRQWWEGAHNLRLKGPIIEYVTNFPSSYTSVDLTEEIVTAPLNWHSNDHNDFNLIDKTRSYCLNCHASQGLADVLLVDGVPSSMTTMTWFGPGWSGGGPWSYPGGGGLITCNGCHDGQGYPTASDQRLRFKGTIRVMGQLS